MPEYDLLVPAIADHDNIRVQALKQLQDKMSHCAYGQSDEETQKWFLRDRKLEVEEAAQKLTNMLKWRQEFK